MYILRFNAHLGGVVQHFWFDAPKFVDGSTVIATFVTLMRSHSDRSFLQVGTLLWGWRMSESLQHLLAPGQIHQVKFPTELLLGLHVLLLDVDEEYAVAPGAVLIHIWHTTTQQSDHFNCNFTFTLVHLADSSFRTTCIALKACMWSVHAFTKIRTHNLLLKLQQCFCAFLLVWVRETHS